MRIGVAADHGGFELKEQIADDLRKAGHDVTDYGNTAMTPGDDYPDYVVPLARAVAAGREDRGIAVCGSGVGASVAANKVPGVRAAMITDAYSAHQGVEDDDMNVLCLGGRVVGYQLARDLVKAFLDASFKGDERFRRRLSKIADVECSKQE